MIQKENASSNNYHKNNYINVTGSCAGLVLQLCTVSTCRQKLFHRGKI